MSKLQFSKIAATIILAMMLIGCAHTVARSGTALGNQRLDNAKLVWVQPMIIPVKYSVLGSSYPNEEEKKRWEKSALKGAQPLYDSIKTNVPADVEAFLRSKGIADGDDALITITPIEVGWVGVGPHVKVKVMVQYKNERVEDDPWSVTILSGVSAFDTVGTTTTKLSSKIIEELTKAGFAG